MEFSGFLDLGLCKGRTDSQNMVLQIVRCCGAAAIRKTEVGSSVSHTLSTKTLWGRHQRDNLIHRAREKMEECRGAFGKEKSKLQLPSLRSRPKAKTIPDGDCEARSFPSLRNICLLGVDIETNYVCKF